MFNNLRTRLVQAPLVALVAIAAVGCGLDKATAPALAGPSEFSTSISLTATPDVLVRDGVSQSIIRVVVRDEQNNPVANQELVLSTTAGLLSEERVRTDAAGNATFSFTAPSLNTPVSSAVISVTPVGTNFENAAQRTVTVALAGPAAATPSFTVTPASPRQFEAATLDASATTVNGQACGGNCTYTWTIGSEATLTGQVVTHAFRQVQTYVVTLDVTSPGGVSTRTQRNVTVTAGVAPSPSFTFSPTNPRPNETVFFNASGSTGANGATIVEYTWDFGNGQTATGSSPTVSTTFGAARTFVVRLTVRDSNGLTATTTQTVTVATT